MGAWGYNSFENDDALDWIAELEESEDTAVLVAAFDCVIEGDAEYVEAEDCSIAIAAAEVVAALNGSGPSSLPEEVSNWLEGKSTPGTSLNVKAQQAIDVVLVDSELKELWEENADIFPKWVNALEELKSRLL